MFIFVARGGSGEYRLPVGRSGSGEAGCLVARSGSGEAGAAVKTVLVDEAAVCQPAAFSGGSCDVKQRLTSS
jgi:hypothetical protein